MSIELVLFRFLLLQHQNKIPMIAIAAIPANMPPISGIILVREEGEIPLLVDFCSAEDPGCD